MQSSPLSPSLDDLLIVGFNRRVFAISRTDGAIRWRWKCPRGGLAASFVSVLVDGDLVIASVDGYTYGLDLSTGRLRWTQPFEGEGTGIASLVSVRGDSSQNCGAAAMTAAAAVVAANIAASS